MTGTSDDAIDRFYQDVGRRVREARMRAGVTQAALALRASMTRSSIANIEAGRQRIAVHVLVLVAGALDVDPKELFSAKGIHGGSPELEMWSAQLQNESPATRDFIQGAIAQLGIRPRQEDER
ncbi:helix-turn-helix transcriptional regulator [Micromonospora sp. NPDC005220]|uniref:helix-turn-helix domain-containing protein n=1 Tax=Micromonospora sp. NPDC005220 TaxID=3155589 RepID=UPI0033A82701